MRLLLDVFKLLVGVVIGAVGTYAIVRNAPSNHITCSECGYRTKDKNIRKCPKCGNPLK